MGSYNTLQHIQVSDNQIVDIDLVKCLSKWPVIRYMDLAGNNITVLQDLSGLQNQSEKPNLEICLKGNPIDCTFDFCWIRHIETFIQHGRNPRARFLMNNMEFCDLNELVCNEPRALRGVSFGTLHYAIQDEQIRCPLTAETSKGVSVGKQVDLSMQIIMLLFIWRFINF